MTTVHAYVYAKDGNRFIFPGHWYCDEDPGVGLGSRGACECEGLIVRRRPRAEARRLA